MRLPGSIVGRLPWLGGLRRAVRRRPRQAAVVAVLAAASVGLLAGAARLDGYAYDLCLNLGASLVLVIAGYLVFNPLFGELGAAGISEHDRLPRGTYLRHVRHATRTVRILETWTDLLHEAYHARFVGALEQAAARGVTVQILLLDPDTFAAEQRGAELSGRYAPVRASIQDNLDALRAWLDTTTLPATARSNIDIRVYRALPSVQMYGWDDKAYLSFYPVDAVSFDTEQIEAFLDTPWGAFVSSRFHQLWEAASTRDLDTYFAAAALDADRRPVRR